MIDDLQILSIFRDSMAYLDRYVAQVREALELYRSAHLIWLEGDSIDGTKQCLPILAHEFERSSVRVTHLELDQGNPYYPSVDLPERWRVLERAWNTALSALESSRLAVCVESDLIWSWDALATCLEHVESGRCEVAAPMLKRGSIFYDTHGFTRAGQHFTNAPPFIPAWDGDQFVPCDTMGGMLCTTYAHLRDAEWRDGCVLRFAPGVRLLLDTSVEIQHP